MAAFTISFVLPDDESAPGAEDGTDIDAAWVQSLLDAINALFDGSTAGDPTITGGLSLTAAGSANAMKKFFQAGYALDASRNISMFGHVNGAATGVDNYLFLNGQLDTTNSTYGAPKVTSAFGGAIAWWSADAALTLLTTATPGSNVAPNKPITVGTASGNVKLSGQAVRGTTEGTNHLDIFDGTAPAGTLANGVSLYSASGELRVMDAAGNSTLLSPHDEITNEWIYLSKNTQTGDVLRVRMERLVAILEQVSGETIAEHWIETVVGDVRELTKEEQAVHLAVDVPAHRAAEAQRLEDARIAAQAAARKDGL